MACEINTCESLIVTELVFENALEDLSEEEVVSLLSCLIFKQRNCSPPVLTERLTKAKDRLETIAASVANVQLKCGVDILPAEFVRENINIGMMQVVYEWARGTSFAKICEVTDVLEGTIVRCITRLDQTCLDVRNAARVVGDPKLYQKMVACSERIKRDIVFAASLYVT